MEKKTSKNILLAIMGVLILAMLVTNICTIEYAPIAAICMIISLIFTSLYGFFLYKKPHGNMLKYAMILFAGACFISTCVIIKMNVSDYSFMDIVNVLAAAAVCYGAGRLNRIEQNRILFPIIDILFLIIAVFWFVGASGHVSVLSQFRLFSNFIILTTLMIAYFVRFKEHKEAGLMDAPKK